MSAAALPKLSAACHPFLDGRPGAIHRNAIASILFRPVESHVRAAQEPGLGIIGAFREPGRNRDQNFAAARR